MTALAALFQDLDGSLVRKPEAARERTLGRIMDLFAHDPGALSPEQVAVFDGVIGRFAAAIEIGARIDLAERLSTLAAGPPDTLAALAADDLAVARPILAGSVPMEDQALVAVAMEKGAGHMLAMCARPVLSETVTDVLIVHGDRPVRHSVAGHAGARLSPLGAATLLDHSRDDEELQDLLGGRDDLSPEHARMLITIAKDCARRQLLHLLPGEAEVSSALDRSARAVQGAMAAPVRDYAGSRAALRAVLDTRGAVGERDIAAFAAQGRLDHVLLSLAHLTGLPVAALERIFNEKNNDLLLVVARAKSWSWRTASALLVLRDPSLDGTERLSRAEDTFDALTAATALRVMHFLRIREAGV